MVVAAVVSSERVDEDGEDGEVEESVVEGTEVGILSTGGYGSISAASVMLSDR